jgi:transposase
VVERRVAFREQVRPLRVEDLVFVDESGIATNMTRRYARAPKGERALGRVPAGHWRQFTVLGGLSKEGLIACMSIEAATDREIFVAFVREVLLPELRSGQVVILDNLNAHKGAEVTELIEAAGCRVLYLPAYSPEFNPIELCWSKLKGLLRSAAARTKEALEEALTAVIQQITAADAQGWFRHCGYAATLQ